MPAMASSSKKTPANRPQRSRKWQLGVYLSDEEKAALMTVPTRERSSFVRSAILDAVAKRQERGSAA